MLVWVVTVAAEIRFTVRDKIHIRWLRYAHCNQTNEQNKQRFKACFNGHFSHWRTWSKRQRIRTKLTPSECIFVRTAGTGGELPRLLLGLSYSVSCKASHKMESRLGFTIFHSTIKILIALWWTFKCLSWILKMLTVMNSYKSWKVELTLRLLLSSSSRSRLCSSSLSRLSFSSASLCRRNSSCLFSSCRLLSSSCCLCAYIIKAIRIWLYRVSISCSVSNLVLHIFYHLYQRLDIF